MAVASPGPLEVVALGDIFSLHRVGFDSRSAVGGFACGCPPSPNSL